MINGAQIRAKRTAAGIPGHILCRKAGGQRSRLSDIERMYVDPSAEELARLDSALDELIEAKRRVREVAEAVGWPIAAQA